MRPLDFPAFPVEQVGNAAVGPGTVAEFLQDELSAGIEVIRRRQQRQTTVDTLFVLQRSIQFAKLFRQLPFQLPLAGDIGTDADQQPGTVSNQQPLPDFHFNFPAVARPHDPEIDAFPAGTDHFGIQCADIRRFAGEKDIIVQVAGRFLHRQLFAVPVHIQITEVVIRIFDEHVTRQVVQHGPVESAVFGICRRQAFPFPAAQDQQDQRRGFGQHEKAQEEYPPIPG